MGCAPRLRSPFTLSANGALDQVLHQRNLVGVVAQRHRAARRDLGRQSAPSPRCAPGRESRPRRRRGAAAAPRRRRPPAAHLRWSLPLDGDRRGDVDQRRSPTPDGRAPSRSRTACRQTSPECGSRPAGRPAASTVMRVMSSHGPMKKSRAAITRSPPPLRTTICASSAISAGAVSDGVTATQRSASRIACSRLTAVGRIGVADVAAGAIARPARRGNSGSARPGRRCRRSMP